MTSQHADNVPVIEDWSHLLDGKIAVVTGGADGIGKGISSLFAAHGAVVEIVDQDEALLKETVEAIQAQGGKAHGFVADVRDADQVTEFKHEVMKRHATVDVLVNNVGDYRPLVRFLDSSPDSWKEMYDINLHHV
ncbi:MAG: SDR family NAD(P)-dependent oxidoreductase, partial [Actinomycetota bacterium]|nr:SDR family NAD(P)-dependent oxidoreductase [Actinomycetota bacterium]